MRLLPFLRTALVVLSATALSHAQRSALDVTPVTLRLMLTVDSDNKKAANVSVEVMDAVGMSSAMDRKISDNSGEVAFRLFSGVHRIRITGSNIKPYDGEVDIARSETVHVERIRLHSAEGADSKKPTPGAGAMIPAIRLRIPSSARKSFDKGTDAMAKQKWKESRAFFETAIRQYPQYDLAYNGLGAVDMQMNEVEAARQAFAKALELNPDFAGANRNMARLLLSEHKNSEALPLLKKSLMVDPENIWALANVANSEFLLNDFSNALLDARKAHTVPHEGFGVVHITAARSLEATEKPAEALVEYRQYLSEEPNGPHAKRAQDAIDRLSASAAQH